MREAGALVRGRRVRARRPLLRPQEIHVFNGTYPQKFVQQPILTWSELRFRAAVLVVACPVAFALALAATYGAAQLVRGGVR